MGLGYHVMPSLDVFIEARYAKGMNRELGTGVIPVVGGVKLLL
jgi:hypothetical protein